MVRWRCDPTTQTKETGYMHRKQNSLTQQQVSNHVQQSHAHTFFNLLTSAELVDTVEELLPEHRERLYPPTETLSMFLSQALQADRSCQHVVNAAAVQRNANGLAPASVLTGGYCKARQRLPFAMVETLGRFIGQRLADQAPASWHWQGRPVRLVDGTTLTMPDTTANQAAFPQPGTQQSGLGFPLCRLVALVCLGSGALLNAALGPYQGKGSGEQSLLSSMLDTLTAGDVLVGDAYYATYFLLVMLGQRGVDGVFEQHGARRRSTDFRCGQRLGVRDHVITLRKPKRKPDWLSQWEFEQAPAEIRVRELCVGGKILMTTLLCARQTPKHALQDLYRHRWHIELDLRSIKTSLGMGRLSCRSPGMVRKEIWVYLLAYNLIRLLMAQAAQHCDCLPRQISFKHTVQLCVAWRQQSKAANQESELNHLFTLIADKQVGNRPGRREPRALKRRPKPYPLLMKPRAVAKQDITRGWSDAAA
jgi:hypothetical protein